MGIRRDVSLGGRYRLVRRIATGGMGTVWEAHDDVLRRRVAVKTLSEALGADPRFVERFRREARAAAGLNHANIAGIYDYGEEGDVPFIVMELVDGETLAERLRRERRLEPGEGARIAAEVAEALQVAHDAGIVHRDVKPANIMLTRRGDVKVMDFGIASAGWAAPITATGTTMGTAAYLSPEQAEGRRATPASDVYALGCVLYEMLTGEPPFWADTPVALATAHLHRTPVPVRERAPHVPPALAEACDGALRKEPSARVPSGAAFAALLRGRAEGAGATLPLAARDGSGGAGDTEVVRREGTAVLTQPPDVARTHAHPPSARGSRRAALIALAAVLGVVALVLVLALAALLSDGGGESPGRRSPAAPAQQGDEPGAETPTGQVPKVRDLPAEDARDLLGEAGFENVNVEFVEGEEAGVVEEVEPKEGEEIALDSPVTLYVGAGEEEDGHGRGNGNGGRGGGGNGNRGKGNDG